MAQTVLKSPKTPVPPTSLQPDPPQSTPEVTQPKPSLVRRAPRRRGTLLQRISVIVAATFLLVVIIAAFGPGLLAPGDPYAGNTTNILQAPNRAHWFGSDNVGRELCTITVNG